MITYKQGYKVLEILEKILVIYTPMNTICLFHSDNKVAQLTLTKMSRL